MRRKAIEVQQDSLVVCDNPTCNYKVPLSDDDLTTEEHLKELEDYIGKRCPLCKHNLLTREDFDKYVKVRRIIHRINRIMSGIFWLFPWMVRKKPHTMTMHVHKGLHIRKEDDDE